MQEVGAGDFGHKGAATSAGLVSVGLQVDLRVVIGGVQEESMGQVRPGLCKWSSHRLKAGR